MNKEFTFTNKDKLTIDLIFNEVGLIDIITVKTNKDDKYYLNANKIFQKLININPKVTWYKTKLVNYSFEIIERQINFDFEDNIKLLISNYGMGTHFNKRIDTLLK